MFRYSEAAEAEGPVDAALGAFGHTIVHLVATVPWLRHAVRGMLPKPGDGPPEAFRENSKWKFTLYGWTAEEGKGDRSRQCQVRVHSSRRSSLLLKGTATDGALLQAVVAGSRDPGYLETSRIALEAGLCLALQGEELTEKGHLQGGVLTPASAMGSVLRERLQAANIQFEITKTGKEVPSSPLDKLKAGKKGASISSGDRNAAAVSGANKESRPVFGCMHAFGAQLQYRLQQRENATQQGSLIVGFEHLHPAVNVLGGSFRHCRKLLTNSSDACGAHHDLLQKCALKLITASRGKLHGALQLAYAEKEAEIRCW